MALVAGPFWETRYKKGSNIQSVGVFGRFGTNRKKGLGNL